MHLTTLFSFASFLTPFALARSWKPSDGCPTTIKTVVSSDPCSYSGSYRCTLSPQFSTMDTVHAALTTCPNISALDLRVTGLGCSEWPDRWNFPFDPAGGEKYPALKSLRLEGYRFDKGAWGREPWEFPKMRYYENWKYDWLWWFPDGRWTGEMASWVWGGRWRTWVRWRMLPVEQRVKSNFGLWLDAMDWSGVEELMIDRISDEVLEKLPGRLQGLKELETTNGSFVEALASNTLTHLEWVGHSEPRDLPAILARQGESLQSLEFRCEELSCPSFAPEFDISILPNMTRNLTHLSINVPRNGTWPLESLQTIASLPHLRSADLYLNLQSKCRRQKPDDYGQRHREWERKYGTNYCTGEDQFQKPFVDKEGAEELFGYMKEKNDGGELTNVTFWVGDWSRPWDGPLYFPPWGEGRSAKVMCSTEDKTGEEGWCVIEAGKEYWKGQRDYPQEWDDEPYL